MEVITKDKKQGKQKGPQRYEPDTNFSPLFHSEDGNSEYCYLLRQQEECSPGITLRYEEVGTACLHLVTVKSRRGKPTQVLVLADSKNISEAKNIVPFAVIQEESTSFKNGNGERLQGENEQHWIKIFLREGKNSYAGNVTFRKKDTLAARKVAEERMQAPPPAPGSKEEEPEAEKPDTTVQTDDSDIAF